MENITLYYRDSTSDKVYQTAIQPKDDGFVVTFAFGRRGSTLTTGTKTSSPVEYPKAKGIYDKLVREKTAKGYSPGEAGSPYQNTSRAGQISGILPQLLNAIDTPEAIRLIHDSNWFAQEKFDGRRLLIRKSSAGVDGINRNGLIVALPQPVMEAVKALEGSFTLDGESIGDTFVAFDLLEFNDWDHRYSTCLDRLFHLSGLIKTDGPHLRTADTASSTASKAAMLERLKTGNKEGMVFKRQDALYVPGRPASGGSALKLKFYETASFVVSQINDMRSVCLALVENEKPVNAGNVTIPSNHEIPLPGDVVEVRYLYAYPESGCVYQPIYLGKRDDLDRSDCTRSQLKYKAAA